MALNDSASRGLPPWISRLNLDWIFVATVVLLASLANFNERLLPLHDSVQAYQIFQYFYSGLVAEQHIPQWCPYGAWGQPQDFWYLMGLSPPGYLVAFAGFCCGATDALVLFKCAMTLDVLAATFGTFLFARLLFHHRAVPIILAIGIGVCSYWFRQLWWDLRIYYMLPFCLSLLWLFFTRSKPQYLWMSGLAFVVSLIGNLPYFAPPYLLLAAVMSGALSVRYYRAWLSLLRPTRANLAWAAVFLVAAGCYMAFLGNSLSLMSTDIPGRDAETHQTTLTTFLTTGGSPNIPQLLSQMFMGWPTQGTWNALQFSNGAVKPFFDQTVYIGILPLVGIAWALARVRRFEFFVVLAMTVALLWFAARGAFTVVTWHLPTIAWFRYCGMLYSMAKVLLLLCAGFGIQDALENGRLRHAVVTILALVFVTDLLVGFNYLFPVLPAFGVEVSKLGDATQNAFALVLGSRILVYGIGLALLLAGGVQVQRLIRRGARPEAFQRLRSWAPPAVLVGCYLFDVLLFAVESRSQVPRVPAEIAQPADYATTAGFPYQGVRTNQPIDERGKILARLMAWETEAPTYLNYPTNGFLRWDPGLQQVYTPLLLQEVNALIKCGRQDKPFLEVLGCDTPKTRVVGRAVRVPKQQALQVVRTTDDLAGVVILEGAGSSAEPLPAGGGGTVDGITFSPDRVDFPVTVEPGNPSWLVYADAWHPGWRATIDDREVAIERAYSAFKAVPVPPGRHTISFMFRPGLGGWAMPLLAWCGALFGLAGLALMGAVACGWQGMWQRAVAVAPEVLPTPSDASVGYPKPTANRGSRPLR